MPDWSYLTVFYPLLRRLPGLVARDVTLQAIGTLAALPGGPGLIAAFGHMDPPEGLETALGGVTLRSPVSIAGEVDPRLLGTAALARFGVGFVGVGPVTVDPLAEACGPTLSPDGQSIVLEDAPTGIGLRAVCQRLDHLHAVAVPIVARIVAMPGAEPDAACAQIALLIDALAERAAAFVLETRWTADALLLPRSAAQATPVPAELATPPSVLCAARAATRRPLLLGVPADAAPDVLECLVRAGLAAGVDGWVIGGGVRRAEGRREVGPAARAATEAVVRQVHALAPDLPIVAEAGVTQPADALALRAAGATFILLHSGLITAGPGLPKRINEALVSVSPSASEAASAAQSASRSAAAGPRGAAWRWLLLLGISMLVGGVLAWVIAAIRVVLPYDEDFLGLSRDALPAVNPRLLAFMAHDRVTLASTMLSIGALYTGLAAYGVRAGAHWAYQAIVGSASVGFASFFLFLGFGYFDPLHAAVSVVLLVFFALGLRGAPRGIGHAVPGLYNDHRWRLSLWGQLCFVSLGVGLILAGLGIALIGVSGVLVQEDVGFLRMPADVLAAVNPRLLPLVAHDRAGFGGALVSDGVGVLLLSLWGFRAGARWVWWTLLCAGLPGFAGALGVHIAVGYLDPLHLAPAVIGSALFVVALGLSYPYLCRSPSVT